MASPSRLKTIKPRISTLDTRRVAAVPTEQGAWRYGKDTAAQRGYGANWQRARELYLREHPLCVHCKARGLVVAASVVDHITPHRGDEDAFWDQRNWQSLCTPCHNRKTLLERAASQSGLSSAALPGWLPAPAVPVHLVCGPPGSGKSSHVAARAAPADLVLDVDVLASEIGGKPIYHATLQELAAAVRARNALLSSLASPACGYDRAWLIATAGTPHARSFWAEKLGTHPHVLTTPKDVCVARVLADVRRPPEARARHLEAIAAWC